MSSSSLDSNIDSDLTSSCSCVKPSAEYADPDATSKTHHDKHNIAAIFSAIVQGDIKKLSELHRSNSLHVDFTFEVKCKSINSGCRCRCANHYERFLESPVVLQQRFFPLVLKGFCFHFEKSLDEISLAPANCWAYLATTPSHNPRLNVLHAAVLCDQLETVEWILSKCDIHVNATTGFHGDTALHLAICRNNLKMVKLLVENGANINMLGKYTGQSALMLALAYDYSDVATYLVSKQCDVTIGIRNGLSPLDICARRHEIDWVQKLLESGADPNGHDGTLLGRTIRGGNLELTLMLLQYGACVNEPSFLGEANLQLSPLSLAIWQCLSHADFMQVVKELLVKGADPDWAENKLYRPLNMAVEEDLSECVELLVKHGADVNKTNDALYAPLHKAAWDGFLHYCKLFVEAGAHVDRQTNDLNTPLSLACHGDQLEVIEYLLQYPCNVNNKDKDDDMPLHYTTFNGNMRASRLLLERGADADAANQLHVTPLWNAVYAKNFPLVRLLLRHNVRLQVASPGILQHAQSVGVVQVYDAPRTPLRVAWEQRYFELFKLLVLAGARTDSMTEPWLASLRYGVLSAECEPRVRTQWLEAVSSPLTLKCCARAAIRRVVGVGLADRLQQLFLPQTLNAYLLFDDI